jgi:hypothetical protein
MADDYADKLEKALKERETRDTSELKKEKEMWKEVSKRGELTQDQQARQDATQKELDRRIAKGG